MKSPSSMKIGRFHPPKNGSDVHPFFQIAWPISNLPHNTRKKEVKINLKIGEKWSGKGGP